ncbi:predicted protein [Botrytis cinerea T4]|uniref:Uncharacterized protein n=1 Tax=Botryotinia fuckeliana (strain T4) TaxID=999810 RepID=G2XZ03_BOTF4|nr:predicted protein [Botrytis cinerea T4]
MRLFKEPRANPIPQACTLQKRNEKSRLAAKAYRYQRPSALRSSLSPEEQQAQTTIPQPQPQSTSSHPQNRDLAYDYRGYLEIFW